MARSKFRTWVMTRQLLRAQEMSGAIGKPLDKEQLAQIKAGIRFGLSLEQVKLYARQYEDAERMKQIRLALEEGCCNEFQLEFYTSKQIEAFRMNVKQGYTTEEAELYSAYACDLPDDKAQEVRAGIKNSLSERDIQILVRACNDYDVSGINKIRTVLERRISEENKTLLMEALNKEISADCIDRCFRGYDSPDYLRKGMECRLSSDEIITCANKKYDDKQMDTICKGRNDGFTFEQMKLYLDGTYSIGQMAEIYRGLEKGLTEEQINFYANAKYSYEQMVELRKGLEKGLTMEQVALYADKDYDWEQMAQIRLGLEAGLKTEQITLYADKEFCGYQMAEIRQGVMNGLSIEQVKLYANAKYDWAQMSDIRERFEKYGLTTKQAMMCIDEKLESSSEIAEPNMDTDGILEESCTVERREVNNQEWKR